MNVSKKSYIQALLVIVVLMIATYIFTLFVPSGEFVRIINESGQTIIDFSAGYKTVEGGISFFNWLLSPILVLFDPNSSALIPTILFIVIIGGVFNVLMSSGIIQYLLDIIVKKFEKKKYQLVVIIAFFFMLLGSLIGTAEEVVPFVPIVIAICASLGFDDLLGITITVLASCCGFACGICNPFTTGIAQNLFGLPMFSGAWLRILSFIIVFAILYIFITRYAKKIDKQVSSLNKEFIKDPIKDKAIKYFGAVFGLGILVILSSAFIKVLADYTTIIVSLIFLITSIITSIVLKQGVKTYFKQFGSGVVSIAPAILMILMATSIKYTLETSKTLDTIIYWFMNATSGSMSPVLAILLIYILVLFLNFFIPSGSAKVLLVLPIVVPIAQLFGISTQLCIVAYCFGDGFSNSFYPTNPILLISLGMTKCSYSDWFKHTGLFQLLIFFVTYGILILGVIVGY